MRRFSKTILFAVLMVVAMQLAAHAKEASKEQIKGLDEQIQEIKSDVLGIAEELNQLEEKLLYPSGTQIAVFLSMAGGEKFRLDAVDINLGGKPVAHYLYTFKELEALQEGGVQLIYTGNIQTGEHDMQVTLIGKMKSGEDYRRTDSFKVVKDVGPKIVELTLAGPGSSEKPISLKDN